SGPLALRLGADPGAGGNPDSAAGRRGAASAERPGGSDGSGGRSAGAALAADAHSQRRGQLWTSLRGGYERARHREGKGLGSWVLQRKDQRRDGQQLLVGLAVSCGRVGRRTARGPSRPL